MTTKAMFQKSEINEKNPVFSSIRSIIETDFYGNNVQEIKDLTKAYQLAKESAGTIETDLPISHAKELGLPSDAKVLVFNDGEIVGRTASARRIIEKPNVDCATYEKILREAVYQSRNRKLYSGKVIVGLDKEFSTQSHLLIPEGFENNLYSYLLNFQLATAAEKEKYQQSTAFSEGDLYLFCDPEWTNADYPDGLVLLDPLHNAAAVLGLRYFGELKKATLTLAWAMANRHGFVACHGGMKQYRLEDTAYTMAVFGLSGSGKSTITLAKHSEKMPVTILHDDAFVISRSAGSATALEPAYFDKTQDYPADDPAIDFFLTCQNVGVTLDPDGKKVLVTSDIRNGNGRTIKSRFVTPNRTDHLKEKVDAVFWLMKDDSLPPVLRINDPILSAVFGLTLATKRSSAENIRETQLDQLVIEPFANPFRAYPLQEDYQAFRDLFSNQRTQCYVLNTGHFNGEKVTPETTLTSIEKIVHQTTQFEPFGPLSEISYLPIAGFSLPLEEKQYIDLVKQRLAVRLRFIEEQEGYDHLPAEAGECLKMLLEKWQQGFS